VSLSIPLLLILGALVIILGVSAILTIAIVAKRCKPDRAKVPPNEDQSGTNAWEESGKRLKAEYDEPE
jgi:hypothetical protein